MQRRQSSRFAPKERDQRWRARKEVVCVSVLCCAPYFGSLQARQLQRDPSAMIRKQRSASLLEARPARCSLKSTRLRCIRDSDQVFANAASLVCREVVLHWGLLIALSTCSNISQQESNWRDLLRVAKFGSGTIVKSSQVFKTKASLDCLSSLESSPSKQAPIHLDRPRQPGRLPANSTGHVGHVWMLWVPFINVLNSIASASARSCHTQLVQSQSGPTDLFFRVASSTTSYIWPTLASFCCSRDCSSLSEFV